MRLVEMADEIKLGSEGRVLRIQLGLLSLAIFLVGAWIIFPLGGWRLLIGLGFLGWANSLSSWAQTHREIEALRWKIIESKDDA